MELYLRLLFIVLRRHQSWKGSSEEEAKGSDLRAVQGEAMAKSSAEREQTRKQIYNKWCVVSKDYYPRIISLRRGPGGTDFLTPDSARRPTPLRSHTDSGPLRSRRST